jgi:hypothetical protein
MLKAAPFFPPRDEQAAHSVINAFRGTSVGCTQCLDLKGFNKAAYASHRHGMKVAICLPNIDHSLGEVKAHRHKTLLVSYSSRVTC